MTSQEFVNQLKKDIQAFPKIRIKHPFLKGRVQRHRDYGSDPRLGDPGLSVSRRRAAHRHDALPGLQRSRDRSETLGRSRRRDPRHGHRQRRP